MATIKSIATAVTYDGDGTITVNTMSPRSSIASEIEKGLNEVIDIVYAGDPLGKEVSKAAVTRNGDTFQISGIPERLADIAVAEIKAKPVDLSK